MADWPSTLPNPLMSGYSMRDVVPLIKTEMEQGPPRVTRYSANFDTIISATIFLTNAQLSIFRDFYDTTTNLGADFFNIVSNTKGTPVLHRCRIVSSPNYRFQNNKWNVSLSLETDERVVV